jgi:hypothetical protein
MRKTCFWLQLEVLSVLLEFGKTLWKVHSKTFDDASLALEFPEQKVERSNFFGDFILLSGWGKLW